jgi:hypothetical protein
LGLLCRDGGNKQVACAYLRACSVDYFIRTAMQDGEWPCSINRTRDQEGCSDYGSGIGRVLRI